MSDLLGDELEETLHIIRAKVLQVALELGLPCVEELVASGGCSLDERVDVIAMLLGESVPETLVSEGISQVELDLSSHLGSVEVAIVGLL